MSKTDKSNSGSRLTAACLQYGDKDQVDAKTLREIETMKDASEQLVDPAEQQDIYSTRS